jgi:hypothetical protein
MHARLRIGAEMAALIIADPHMQGRLLSSPPPWARSHLSALPATSSTPAIGHSPAFSAGLCGGSCHAGRSFLDPI